MYEDLRKEVNWESDHPAGAYFHAAGFDDSGNNMYVADVWESEEQFNNFIRTRITPVMEKINAPKPKAEVYPIHNVNAFPVKIKRKKNLELSFFFRFFRIQKN